jgi:hypothetical protein
MKRILLVTLATFMFSCSNDDETEPVVNCDCDKVVEVSTFNVIGTPQNPTISYYSVFTTINVCTQVQRQKTFTTTIQSLSPQLGECR